MAIEDDLKQWIAGVTGVSCFHQHVESNSLDEFIWFARAGDDSEDELDPVVGEEPDRVYFDVEIYAQTSSACSTIARTLRSKRDYRGQLSPATGRVDDVLVEDTQDDYEPQAEAQDIPEMMSTLRLVVSGYQP